MYRLTTSQWREGFIFLPLERVQNICIFFRPLLRQYHQAVAMDGRDTGDIQSSRQHRSWCRLLRFSVDGDLWSGEPPQDLYLSIDNELARYCCTLNTHLDLLFLSLCWYTCAMKIIFIFTGTAARRMELRFHAAEALRVHCNLWLRRAGNSWTLWRLRWNGYVFECGEEVLQGA